MDNPAVLRLLEQNFYFLKDTRKGICLCCHQMKPIIMGAGKCLDCMIEEQTFKAIDKNMIDKSYVQVFLNTGKFVNSKENINDPDAVDKLFTAVNDIWKEAKTAYFLDYLAQWSEKLTGGDNLLEDIHQFSKTHAG